MRRCSGALARMMGSGPPTRRGSWARGVGSNIVLDGSAAWVRMAGVWGWAQDTAALDPWAHVRRFRQGASAHSKYKGKRVVPLGPSGHATTFNHS